MNWDKLRELLNNIAEDDNAKALLDAQAICLLGAEGSVPVHLSQSLVDGELILLPMELASK